MYLAVLFLFAIPLESARALIVIDEFSDFQDVATSAPGTTSAELDGLDVLGGSRELTISALASNLAGGARINIADTTPDALLYDPTIGDSAIADGQIIWDGNQDNNMDPEGFNADGLGADGDGMDLNSGDLIRVVVNSSLPSDESSLAIEVASDGGLNSAISSRLLPIFGSNAITNYDFLFAEFPGVDFSDVSAIRLIIDTSADPGLQVEIERVIVTTIPEPSTLVLLILGVVGMYSYSQPAAV